MNNYKHNEEKFISKNEPNIYVYIRKKKESENYANTSHRNVLMTAVKRDP